MPSAHLSLMANAMLHQRPNKGQEEKETVEGERLSFTEWLQANNRLLGRVCAPSILYAGTGICQILNVNLAQFPQKAAKQPTMQNVTAARSH